VGSSSEGGMYLYLCMYVYRERVGVGGDCGASSEDGICIKPQTPNPKPQTLNPKTQTLNPKPQTLNPKSQTLNPKRLLVLCTARSRWFERSKEATL
jgi:hypothetical protein